MKKIGLVGGTGPESTLMYYKELNLRIDKITDGKQMPEIVIESLNFRRAWNYVSSGRYDLLKEYLSEKVYCLKKAGAEVISLTAVTMHIVFEELVKDTGVSLISIPKAVCKEVKRSDEKTVYVGKLMVHPDQQKKGYGKKLLRELEGYYPNKRFELFTSTRSLYNIRLYENMGYKKFKEEKVTDELVFAYMEKE